MSKVVSLGKKTFSIVEANDLLPLIIRITKETATQVKNLVTQVENSSEVKRKSIEDEINNEVQNWQTKIGKLGAEAKGLWLVDFDCGNGYLCWKYPEKTIEHFHGYTEGFQTRIKI